MENQYGLLKFNYVEQKRYSNWIRGHCNLIPHITTQTSTKHSREDSPRTFKLCTRSQATVYKQPKTRGQRNYPRSLRSKRAEEQFVGITCNYSFKTNCSGRIICRQKTRSKRTISTTFSGSRQFRKRIPHLSKTKCQTLYTSRNVPLPLRGKVKDELDKMESMGVISKIEEACAGMVVVPKREGKVRICVDLKKLNENVMREIHPLPKVDETVAGAKIFSKLDANSGFWQIPLSKSSRLLTTFITPYGRYCFNKMTFGISSAPEHFQRRMSHILVGLQGVLCLMDDVLIHGKDQQEHDTRLMAALKRIQDAGVTLNYKKCEFNKTNLIFLGHKIDGNGIKADPGKTAAISKMEAPQNVTTLSGHG